MLNLYLAHPILSRREVRAWELFVESHWDVSLLNPFYDSKDGYVRGDIRAIDSGRMAVYSRDTGVDIVTADLSMIDRCDGGLAVLDDNITVGTLMEMFYAKNAHMPVLTLCTNERLQTHPWIRYCTDVLFVAKEQVENYFTLLPHAQRIPLRGIGLVGKKHTGKDTVGKHLVDAWGFKRFAFADELKETARRLWGFSREELVDKPPSVRAVLQDFASEGMRKLYPDLWLNIILRRMKRYSTVLPSRYNRLVVTDVRFTNEAAALKRLGFHLVRLVRNIEAGDSHVSETEQDSIVVDHTVHNTGTVGDLLTEVDSLVAGWVK